MYLGHRSGSDTIRYGQTTSTKEHPWFVLLEYADTNRSCAGSLISDRHVLTARLCVDAAGPGNRSNDEVSPENLKIRYGLRGNYGGLAKVKSIKPFNKEAFKDGRYNEIAVIELSLTVSLGEDVRPICLAEKWEDVPGISVYALHWGPQPEDRDQPRPMYLQNPYVTEFKRCTDMLGLEFQGDNFCLVRPYLMFVEGVYAGAPILKQVGTRWLQIGIAVKADLDTNSLGSATRVDLFHFAIQQLSGCYIRGEGLNSYQSKDKETKCDGQ
ncbi:Peptidase S1/S6 [Aphelenchoides avenae]|nr:Peptidase S1/S6 [Aphelenchus avenae]